MSDSNDLAPNGPVALEGTFHHASILVPDMDRAVAWFRDVLGLRVHPPMRMTTHGRVDRGEFGDDEQHEGTTYLAWVAEGPPYFEIIESKGPEHGRGLHSLEKHGAGLHHVGCFVPDVDEQLERLSKNGVPIEARVIGPDGRTMVCWTEPDPVTGLAVEYLHESMRGPIQGWIERGEVVGMAGVTEAQ